MTEQNHTSPAPTPDLLSKARKSAEWSETHEGEGAIWATIAVAEALRGIRDILRRARPDPDDALPAALIDAALRVTDALGAVRVAGASGDLREVEAAMRRLGTANAALEIAARQYQSE